MNGHELRCRKPRRGGVEIRLIVFGALAVLLIVFSLFSEYLTPYDPYLQDLSNAKLPPRRSICWARTAMAGIC